MQDAPLTITSILERGERMFATREIVTKTATGKERATFADLGVEVRRQATALDALGVSPDGRVASFAWNTFRHLALYYSVPCTGRVLHTGNIRYFPDQLVYTFEHAEDEAVFIDRSLLGLLAPLLPRLTMLKHVVVMDDGAPTPLPDDPRIVRYEELLDGARSLGELDVARELRRRGLPRPDRQVLRRDRDNRYYLDLYWAEFRLVLEIDGIHHAWAGNVVGDALRQNALALAGDTVLRLPLLGLRLRPDDFFAQVEQALLGAGWQRAA